jgi:hypothetical protein
MLKTPVMLLVGMQVIRKNNKKSDWCKEECAGLKSDFAHEP